MKKKFIAACELLDDMTKIDRACYTRDGPVSSTHMGPSKEQLAKDKDRHKNMAKMLTT